MTPPDGPTDDDGERWSDEAVADAFAAWLWVPDGAVVEAVPGGQFVLYPEYVGQRAQVAARPAPEEVEEALDRAVALAREAGQELLVWHVPEEPATEPLVALLRERGAEVEETLDRLALPLARREAPGAPAPGVEVRPVLTEAEARAIGHVDEVVFDLPALTEERLPRLLAEAREEHATRSGARVVAWRHGDDGGIEPVGSAGFVLAGDVARLYGGATLPEHRRRGVYGALLDARLDLAEQWGATLALVKGRVSTSAPILRRRGFVPHGREVSHRLRV